MKKIALLLILVMTLTMVLTSCDVGAIMEIIKESGVVVPGINGEEDKDDSEDPTPEYPTPEDPTPDNPNPGNPDPYPTPDPKPDKPTPDPDPTPDKPDQKDTIDISAFSVDEEITIKFYHTMGQSLRAVLDEYIPKFNKLYPNIKIEHEQIGGYDDVFTQIRVETNVGRQPNMAYCYPDHVAVYNLAGTVVTLDQLISSTAYVKRADGSTEMVGLTEKQKADFISAFLNEGSAYRDGYTYTMPMSKSTEVLYYNKTFFDAYNLKVPTTWEEMEAVCRQIKAIDPSCIPLGYDSESNWFINLCAQYGSDYTSATGEHFLFDNQTNRDFVKMLNGWYNDGLVITQELLGAYTSSLFVEQDPTRPNSYMTIASSVGANFHRPYKIDGSYPFEVGVAPIPQVDPTNPKVIQQGPSLCIFRGRNISDQQIVASWLFIKYLTTNVGFQTEFATTAGYIPVTKSAINSSAYSNYLKKADGGDNVASLAAKVAVEQSDAYFASPAFVGSSTARDQVGIILQKCLVLTTNIDEEIKKLFEDAIEELKQSI